VSADELISYAGSSRSRRAVRQTLDVRWQPSGVIEAKGLPLPFPLTEHLCTSGARLRKVLQ